MFKLPNNWQCQQCRQAGGRQIDVMEPISSACNVWTLERLPTAANHRKALTRVGPGGFTTGRDVRTPGVDSYSRSRPPPPPLPPPAPPPPQPSGMLARRSLGQPLLPPLLPRSARPRRSADRDVRLTRAAEPAPRGLPCLSPRPPIPHPPPHPSPDGCAPPRHFALHPR